MKNDIEKMRIEFDEKIKLAIIENELSEGCNGYYFNVVKNTGRNKTAEYRIWASTPYKSGVGFTKLNKKQVAEILKRFPMTGKTKYDGDEEYDYIIHSQNSYGSREAELSICWQSGDYEVDVTMSLDENKDISDEFFTIGTRETVETENSTYASIQRYNSHGHECRYYVRVFDFKKKQKRYYGGVRLLTDNEEIARLIDYIKNK